jgi:poly-gamma-glutamate synthesis protein (capsule biosynthesis protein)
MNTIKIACVGDIMCGDSFYAIGRGVASSLRKYGQDFLQPEIVRFLSTHDLVLCNLECALSDLGRKDNILRSVHMRGLPEAATHLADWGIKVANVANNHILEHGSDCAIDTVRRLHAAGVRTIGAGKQGLFEPGIQTTEVVVNGRTIAFLGACFRKEKYAFYGGAKLDEILDTIGVLTSQGKTVIASVHWGDELMDRPNPAQRRIAHQLVDAGASLVIGHHPHVVQGIEEIKSAIVAYSLGNFVFDSFLAECSWSIALSVEMANGDIARWSYVPVEKDAEHRPKFVDGGRKIAFEQEIGRRCDLLQIKVASDQYKKEYQSDLKAADLKARGRLLLELLKKTPNMRFVYWPQILLRPVQRRLGVW